LTNEGVSSKEIRDNDTIWTDRSIPSTMCKLLMTYATDLLVKSKDVTMFKDTCVLLLPHIKLNSLLDVWLLKYLTKHKTVLFGILIESDSIETREALRNVIVEAIRVVAKVEQGYMKEVVKVGDVKKLSRSAVVRLIDLLIVEGLNYARINNKTFEEYFSVLISFASLDSVEVEMMISCDSIYALIDFIANTSTPLNSDTVKNRPVMLEPINLSSPIKLLFILILNCATQEMKQSNKYPKGISSSSILLPENQVQFIFSPKWNYCNFMPQYNHYLTSILIHLTWENERRIERVITDLIRHVWEKKEGFEVLESIIKVQDSYCEQRYLIFAQSEVARNKSIYELLESFKDSQDILDWIQLILHLLQAKAEFIMEDKSRWEWILPWLENKKIPHSKKVTLYENFLELLSPAKELDLQEDHIEVNSNLTIDDAQ